MFLLAKENKDAFVQHNAATNMSRSNFIIMPSEFVYFYT